MVVGYCVKIFHPSPPNYVTRSPGKGSWKLAVSVVLRLQYEAGELK